MFYDLHTDILYDIVKKRLEGKRNIIKQFHIPELFNGNIIGGIWTYFTDITSPLCPFDKAIDFIIEELVSARDYIQIIKTKNDFNTKKVNVILGFESLEPVKNLKQLKKLYDYGFRHAMLTWNEQNQYATGVLSSAQRGLTEKGQELIRFMNENRMIIDVSHANAYTFDEILSISAEAVIASHSNVDKLCPNRRNLTDRQILKLTEKGGIIGITAVKNFVNPDNPTIAEMVKHIDYLNGKNLLNQVALGFDFMNYLGDHGNLTDLPSASYSSRLIEELYKHRYTDEEIDKITHKNALRFINSII